MVSGTHHSPFLLAHIQGCALGEGDAVGAVECPEAHLPGADAQFDDGNGAQHFAVLAGIELKLGWLRGDG